MSPTFVSQFEQALLNLDRLAAKRVSEQASQTLSASEFVEKVVVPSLDRVGEGWEEGTVALSQVYMSGRISEEIVDTLLPASAPERNDQPRMAVAVFEDYHLLGKRIVYTMLRASGFELLDYGHVEIEGLIQRVHGGGPRKCWMYCDKWFRLYVARRRSRLNILKLCILKLRRLLGCSVILFNSIKRDIKESNRFGGPE